jgi:hypothetical protein
MLFADVDSIRDTKALPKTASAVSLINECPSEVSTEQLRELHIKVSKKNLVIHFVNLQRLTEYLGSSKIIVTA